MQTWPLTDVQSDDARVQTSGRDDLTAALIDRVGTAAFDAEVLKQVGRIMPLGSVSAYVLSRDRAPELLLSATRQQPDRTPECWQVYRSWLYRQDRTFDQAWASPSAQLTHCTRAAFAPAHRQQIYERAGSRERLSLTAPADSSSLLAINFYRSVEQPGFTAEDAATVAAIALSLIACVKQQRRLLQPEPVSVRKQLQRRCERLTERELDVLEQLAMGCSYEGTAAALGVTLANVKTYRERAFLKLGIHFRNQLYGLMACGHIGLVSTSDNGVNDAARGTASFNVQRSA